MLKNVIKIVSKDGECLFFLREAQFVVVTVRFINNIMVDIVFIEFNDCVL